MTTPSNYEDIITMVAKRKGVRNIAYVTFLWLCMTGSLLCLMRYTRLILPQLGSPADFNTDSVCDMMYNDVYLMEAKSPPPPPQCPVNGPRREPTWKWFKSSPPTKNSNENMTGIPPTKRRLLIGQYSGYGPYQTLLNKTAPINLSYAQRHGHDLVILLGTTQILPEDGLCEPMARRASYNKLALLQESIRRSDEYDQLLIVDADAVMYDLEFDVTKLLYNEDTKADDLLAAKGVHGKAGLRSWNVNNGVTLWNLKHPIIQDVVNKWESIANYGVANDKKMHGDQHYLHQVLKGNSTFVENVRALRKEFDYKRGLVVKHFVRSTKSDWVRTGLEQREELIDAAIIEICSQHESFCQHLDEIDFVA